MLPKTAHTDQPWRVHELAPDFKLSDVWALPTPGGPDDFPRLVDLIRRGDTEGDSPAVVRALFLIRKQLGEWLQLDVASAGAGARVPSVRDRLPEAERAELPAPGPVRTDGPTFTPVFGTDNEWAGELANKTVHCLMHLGWVPDPDCPGGYRGQMAVLVKPNGLGGRAYLAAIAPFRHRLVYPALLRAIEARWAKASASPRTR